MGKQAFDEFADKYDSWFLENQNVLESEVRLLAAALGRPGRTLSVGCGSGLFEMLLLRDHEIRVEFGAEPAEPMAEIARKRGMQVKIGPAESLPFDDGEFETVLFNGTPSYISGLGVAFREAWRVLAPGGRVVVADVPKESSYGLLYRLASEFGGYDHPALEGALPQTPYPIEFASTASWRSTAEKIELLREVGFTDLSFTQTLTRHPAFSNEEPEDPVSGFDRGDYVAIRATRPE